jgi:hypothetical protein
MSVHRRVAHIVGALLFDDPIHNSPVDVGQFHPGQMSIEVTQFALVAFMRSLVGCFL